MVAEYQGLEVDGGEPVLESCNSPVSAPLRLARTYDRLGRITTLTDESGVTTDYRYDLAGHVTHEIVAAGTASETVTEYRYDDAGRLETTLTPPPNLTTFDWWDPANDLAKVAIANAYTAGGRLAAVTAPNPNRPVVEEDPELAGLVWANDVTTTYGYDAAGRPSLVSSPLAGIDPSDAHNPQVTEYDALGRVSTVTSSAGRDVTYTYDSAGNVVHVDAPAGDGDRLVHSFRYDALGRTTHESAGHASVLDNPSTLAWTEYAFAANGDLTTVWDANGYRTDYGYNVRGARTTQTTFAAADPTHLSDPQPLGIARYERWALDLSDRVTATWLEDLANLGPRLQETTFGYTNIATGVDDGRLHAVENAAGESVSYEYDRAMIDSVIYDDGASPFEVAHTYDDRALLTESVDSRDTNAPVSRTYDIVGNLMSLDNNINEPTAWSWGTAGNVMTRDGDMTESFYYDLDGRMVENWAQDGWLVLNIGTWTYDPDGLVTDDTYLEAHWTSLPQQPITYLGRFYNRDDGGKVSSYGQATVHWLSGEWQHYTLTALDYDASGRLSFEHEGIAIPDTNGDPEVISDRQETYTYDPAGQLTGVYDEISQTTIASWTFGPAGRRATSTTTAGTSDYIWNSLGQLTSVEPPTGPINGYTYDAAGRRTSATDGTTTTNYEWDATSSLTHREQLDATTNDEIWTESRGYDPSGMLVSITTTDHDNNTEASDSLSWDTTWSHPKLDKWLHTPDNGPVIEYEFGQGPGGTPRIDSELGNIWVTDVRGTHFDPWAATQTHTIAGDTTYDWWGTPTTDTDQQAWLGYRGELTTQDGLIHLQHRDYDPTTGVFLTTDPLPGLPGDPTLATTYHYADNNPLNMVDPLGLRPKDDDMRGPSTPEPGAPSPSGNANRSEPDLVYLEWQQRTCMTLLIAETTFFNRDANNAMLDYTYFSEHDPNVCGGRLAELNGCVEAGGHAMNWTESPFYQGPTACGNWVKDCSTARWSLLCDHAAILLKASWSAIGGSLIYLGHVAGIPVLQGCGLGLFSGALLGGDDVGGINASALGSCLAAGGAASGSPVLACVAGLVGTGVVATYPDWNASYGAIGCLFGAVGVKVGDPKGGVVAQGVGKPWLVNAAVEMGIQCSLGALATPIVSSSGYGSQWEALMGCTGGAVGSRIDTY